MFLNKTVFVVGAGGSYELGLPIGDGLAQMISEKLNYNSSRSGDAIINDAIRTLCGSSRTSDLKAWFDAATEISGSMPLALSIDNYLHTHSADKKIIDIGKMAIARSILEAEANSDIYCQPHERIAFSELHATYRRKNQTPSWHNTFFKMLTENVKRENLSSVFTNVSIITFNYDRCIEHYLANAFSQYMSMMPSDARALCNNLEIIHPYGKVGSLAPGEGTYVAFGAELRREQLIASSRQIRTFTEQQIEEDTVALIRERLREAKNVVFLGFSYGEMNLTLMQTTGEREQKNIIGTALGVSQSNRSFYERRLRTVLQLDYPQYWPINLEDSTCYKALNDFSKLLLS